MNFIIDQLDILDPIEIEEEYNEAIDEVFPSLIGLVYYLSECPYYLRNENIKKKELNKIVNVSYGNMHNFE